MAKVHAQQDPSLWQGPGKLEYRHTTAGKKGTVVYIKSAYEHLWFDRGTFGKE